MLEILSFLSYRRGWLVAESHGIRPCINAAYAVLCCFVSNMRQPLIRVYFYINFSFGLLKMKGFRDQLCRLSSNAYSDEMSSSGTRNTGSREQLPMISSTVLQPTEKVRSSRENRRFLNPP
jgi:hypothetical protein